MNYLKISEIELLMDLLSLDKQAFGDRLVVTETQQNNDLEFLRSDGEIQLNPFYHSKYFESWLKQNLRKISKGKNLTIVKKN